MKTVLGILIFIGISSVSVAQLAYARYQTLGHAEGYLPDEYHVLSYPEGIICYEKLSSTQIESSIRSNFCGNVYSCLSREGCYRDTIPFQEFEFTGEKRPFMNFMAEKALSFFRGYHWAVWFCEDLDANLTPWKIRGLPGAIVELINLDRTEIGFTLVEVQIPAKVQLPYTEPECSKWISLKTIMEKTIKYDLRFAAYMNTAMPESNGTIVAESQIFAFEKFDAIK
ncbi:MAG: hypothetical protein RIS47_1028 [Bacteroidota bacterium]|jgi:hypothetical protein